MSSHVDDRRICLGLKFSIPGFFGAGKFGKYMIFFWGGGCGGWGVQNNLKIRGSDRLGLRMKYNQTC